MRAECWVKVLYLKFVRLTPPNFRQSPLENSCGLLPVNRGKPLIRNPEGDNNPDKKKKRRKNRGKI
ncbi:hypothetical protein COW09_01595 [bacterium (Candidatus Moisslbacteria) CG12_big_fil_rev_8_21_14_0_65_36_11]|nr:MAG: hypothetical protein COW09_01595 [bacterium (Candidatus Moisslbacteria) CG12_big_fil_rev_8_21_14_0_65_36_11]